MSEFSNSDCIDPALLSKIDALLNSLEDTTISKAVEKQQITSIMFAETLVRQRHEAADIIRFLRNSLLNAVEKEIISVETSVGLSRFVPIEHNGFSELQKQQLQKVLPKTFQLVMSDVVRMPTLATAEFDAYLKSELTSMQSTTLHSRMAALKEIVRNLLDEAIRPALLRDLMFGQTTVELLNEKLNIVNEQRKREGLPTFSDIIAHEFGLRPFMLIRLK
jgi:alpha-mannosidase